MPGKKKKYNARFPPARIKKIMQSDEEVGKVAAPVPVIISRALEMFAETLLVRANEVTTKRGARTLTPSHLKFCIESEARFDFLRELVSAVPDLQSESADGLGEGSPVVVATGLGAAGPALPPGIEISHHNTTRGRGRGGAYTRGGRSGGATESADRKPPQLQRGTGKRRGRPPKVNGTLGRPKPTEPRYVDEDQDIAPTLHTVSDDEDGDDDDDDFDGNGGGGGEHERDDRLAGLANGHHFRVGPPQAASYQRSFSLPVPSYLPADQLNTNRYGAPSLGALPNPGSFAFSRSFSHQAPDLQAVPDDCNNGGQQQHHHRSDVGGSTTSSLDSGSHSFVRSLHSATAAVARSAAATHKLSNSSTTAVAVSQFATPLPPSLGASQAVQLAAAAQALVSRAPVTELDEDYDDL